MRFDYQMLLKSPPLNLLDGSAPGQTVGNILFENQQTVTLKILYKKNQTRISAHRQHSIENLRLLLLANLAKY